MSAGLLQRWRALAGEGADALGEALIGAWSQPHRVYHDQSHLVWLLDEAGRRAALIRDAAFVGYAIWFHDAVYEPGKPDNETRSADWARDALTAQPSLAARVASVIEMTKDHAAGSAEGDAALFLDMDIAILGEPRERYRAYAAAIRKEYGIFPDEVFANGRSAFLRKELARERLFRTDVYERDRGAQARANMAWELGELGSGRMIVN